jgi:hypothetical protein
VLTLRIAPADVKAWPSTEIRCSRWLYNLGPYAQGRRGGTLENYICRGVGVFGSLVGYTSMRMRTLKVALLFALLGPLMGTLAFSVVAVLSDARLASDWLVLVVGTFGFSAIVYPTAALLGLMPAAITGAAFSYLVQCDFLVHRNRFVKSVFCAGLGALFCGVPAIALHRPLGDTFCTWVFILGSLGAFSAAILALVMISD